MANEISEALKKFFSPKDEIIEHWYVPLDNFQFATADFYQTIEKELLARKVPDLEISRVELSEGGLLSHKREYLRLQRERLVFDICAAPFGTSYFFSFRFVERPLGIKPMELLVFLIVVGVILGVLINWLGTLLGLLAVVGILGGGMVIIHNSPAPGLKNLDAKLIKAPVIGALYELFLRKDTYHRQDTRLMYLSTVNGITETLVQEVTTAKGIKLLKRFDRKPPSGNLYQATTTRLDKSEDTPKPTS